MADFFNTQKPKKDLWYKEPWMLLVVGGPVIVVIAGIITFYIAWQGSDKIISKDYYKQGLNIDKDIQRDAKAVKNKMRAMLELDSATGKISLQLESAAILPSAVTLNISASSSSAVYELLHKVTLSQMKPGIYEGTLKIASNSANFNLALWHIKIEAADWRLTADWHDPMHASLQLKTIN